MYSQSMTSRPSHPRSLSWSRIASTLALLALCACSETPRTSPVVLNLPKPPDKVVLPLPQPIQVTPFKWIVITPGDLPAGTDWVLFAVTPEDYKALARTQADTLRWVTEAGWRLKYYALPAGSPLPPMPDPTDNAAQVPSLPQPGSKPLVN